MFFALFLCLVVLLENHELNHLRILRGKVSTYLMFVVSNIHINCTLDKIYVR